MPPSAPILIPGATRTPPLPLMRPLKPGLYPHGLRSSQHLLNGREASFSYLSTVAGWRDGGRGSVQKSETWRGLRR